MEKFSNCAVCQMNSFDASICIACVKRSLKEYKVTLYSLKSRREVSFRIKSGMFWRTNNSRNTELHLICPSEYMVQLLNLVVHKLAVPALHNLGFGGSCSRIWQRDSYWNSHPYPPRIFFLCLPMITTHSKERVHAPTNFGVTSLRSYGSVEDDYHDLDIVNVSSDSPHSVETFRNLQRGIAHLKQSVARLTVYGYSSLSLEVPSGASSFETFAKLLATLSSLKEVQSACSHALSSYNNQRQEPKKSEWNLNSSSSSTLLNSFHTQPTTWNCSCYNVPNRDPSYMVELPDF